MMTTILLNIKKVIKVFQSTYEFLLFKYADALHIIIVVDPKQRMLEKNVHNKRHQ